MRRALIGGRLRSQRIDAAITTERIAQTERGLDWYDLADGADQFGARGIHSPANMQLPIGLRFSGPMNTEGAREQAKVVSDLPYYPRGLPRKR